MNTQNNKALHQKMWQWLADNPKKKKEDWPEWVTNGGDIPLVKHHCFACHESYNRNGVQYDSNDDYPCDCSTCPVDWGDSEYCCDTGSVYDGWWYAPSDELKTKYALLVKDAWK